MIEYRYKEVPFQRIGCCRVAVAKIQDGKLLGIQQFDLRTAHVPEGSDPFEHIVAKHRNELRW